jgi:hypothetical protein
MLEVEERWGEMSKKPRKYLIRMKMNKGKTVNGRGKKKTFNNQKGTTVISN